MKIIQAVLQKITASKLWFSMMVVFMVIFNVSVVEAKSLKIGEEFKVNDGGKWGIRVISSDEVEVDGQGNSIFLGKYSIEGERVRVVTSAFGSAMVTYYKITPDGLVEEKDGRVFYSLARLGAIEKMIEAEERRKTLLSAVYVLQGGLTWMPVKFHDNWANSNDYCANTTINGLTGWRLPTQVELSALYASKAMNGKGWTLDSTWSSVREDRGVNLNSGGIGSSIDAEWDIYYVTCVRKQ